MYSFKPELTKVMKNWTDATNKKHAVDWTNNFLPEHRPTIADGSEANGEVTKIVAWDFAFGELGSLEFNPTFEGKVVLQNNYVNSEYPKNIYLTVKFSAELPTATFNAVKEDIYWNGDYFVINPNIPDGPEDIYENFFYDQNIYEAYHGGIEGITLTYAEFTDPKVQPCARGYFDLVKVYDAAEDKEVKTDLYPNSGIEWDGTNFSFDQLRSDKVKAALNNGTLMAKFNYYVKYNNDDTQMIQVLDAHIVKPVHMYLPQNLSLTPALDGGDHTKVFFGEGLGGFYDWRGPKFQITPEAMKLGTRTALEWKLDCAGKHGYFTLISAGKFELIKETVEVPAYETVYVATVTADLYNAWVDGSVVNGNTPKGVVFTTKPCMNEEDALAELKKLMYVDPEEGLTYDGRYYATLDPNDNDKDGQLAYIVEWRPTANPTIEKKVTETTTEMERIVDVVYEAPVYAFVPQDCDAEAPLNVEPEYVGQRNGCWVGAEVVYPAMDITAAQYWNFYGFGDFSYFCKFSFDKKDGFYTSLSHKELPEDVTLEQIGNEIYYRNVDSPVQTGGYTIYVPVSVPYKFGELKGTVEIKINSIYDVE